MTECESGRTAFLGGAWTVPCTARANHHISSPESEPIRLCEEHFQQVLAAGLVTEVNIPAEDFAGREQARTDPGGLKGFLKRRRERG